MKPAQISMYPVHPEARLEDNSQNIVRQDSQSPRVNDSGFRPPIPEPLFRREAFQAVVSKLLKHYPDLVLKILLNSDLPTILQLRLVSKVFWLASITNTEICSPLTNKAAISFLLTQFHPTLTSSIKEKYEFAVNNTEINIPITLAGLFNPLQTLNSIPKNKLKVILLITSPTELNRIQTLLLNQDDDNTNKTQVLDLLSRIKELKFDFTINKNFEKLLNTISNNERLFSNLEKLYVSHIDDDVEIKFPKLPNLKKLDITTVGVGISLDLESCEGLESFSIKMSHNNTLKLAKSLDKLKTLTIKHIYNNQITLPQTKLKNLQSLSLCSFYEWNHKLIFPEIDNLQDLTYNAASDHNMITFAFSTVQTLTIEYVGPDYPNSIVTGLIYETGVTRLQKKPNFDFLSQLTGLSSFSIKYIDDDTILEFPNLTHKNLRTLSIGSISKNIKINPSTFWNNIETFSIDSIDYETVFCIPKSCFNLKKLSIGTIHEGATFKIPALFTNLTSISIQNIEANSMLEFPNSDHKMLKLFSIGSIGRNVKITESRFWNSLEEFSIDNIERKAVFHLPKSCFDLKKLSIGCIDAYGVLIIPPSFLQTVQLSFRTICKGAKLHLPLLGDIKMKENIQAAWTQALYIGHSTQFYDTSSSEDN